MNETVLILAACAGVIVTLLWSITCISYRVTREALEVRLFGCCLRRVLLTDIRSVSTHHDPRSEKWPNTFLPEKRILVIKRHSGWRKNFLITPKNRYAFRREIEAMREKYCGSQNSGSTAENEVNQGFISQARPGNAC